MLRQIKSLIWLAAVSVHVSLSAATTGENTGKTTPRVSCESLTEGKKENLPDPKKEEALPRDRATLVLEEWMRDPFITLGPDNYYYLSCTRLWHTSFKKPGLEIWRSKDLRTWEETGQIWTFDASEWMPDALKKAALELKKDPHLWAPEIHFLQGKWVVVCTTSLRYSNLMVTGGTNLKGPFTEPFGQAFGYKHDPSIFADDDGTKWLIWGCTKIAPLNNDFSGFTRAEQTIGPSNRKMGHEGCFILKIEGRYVLFGTAWSTDILRHGSYNLYYCTADRVEGPYGPRKFAGRFLGHGNLFKDRQGQWWCTAFLNGDYVSPDQVVQNGVSLTRAETINKQGLTLVPMKVMLENGDIVIRAGDPVYARPGKDEVQDFSAGGAAE